MKLIPRGNVWWVEFYDAEGGRRKLSTGVSRDANKADAESAAKRVVSAAVSKGATSTLAQALERTFTEHWQGQKSERAMRHMVTALSRDVGDMKLRACNYEALKTYGQRLKESGLANATINRRMSALGVALKEAARRGECDRPDLPHYTENNTRERYLTETEEAGVLSWLDRKVASDKFFGSGEWDFVRSLFLLLIDTGMRFSEAFIAEGRGPALHLKHGDTKSGKARSIPLTTRAFDAWQCLALSRHYRVLKGDPNAWAWVDHRWKQVVAGAGCPDVTLHILRHTCASRLIQRGVDLFTVSKWLGHSSMKVTERYAHLAPDTLSRALSALQGSPVAVPDREESPLARAG